MDTLRAAARRLDLAAETVADTGNGIELDGPAGHEFGADGTGRLGELGRALHGRWLAAVEDRRAEAADIRARLAELAESLRLAADGYADTDHAVRHRQSEEG